MAKRNLVATLRQVIRYGVVGVLNNFLGYLIYILITWAWLDPKLAVTLMYPIGALTAYFGHEKYSFAYNGSKSQGVFRYTVAHLIGYCVNVAMLFVFYEWLGYPHQIVQGIAIVVVAGVLFLLFRYYVFRQSFEQT